jgi:uncharacterized protein (DUF488 family)
MMNLNPVQSGDDSGPPQQLAMPLKIVTIGAYGFDEQTFFNALAQAGVDTFCDVRFRRGVRGSIYAFVNSQRLQSRLAEEGIRYLHFRDLAPSVELRRRQALADKAVGVAKRQRHELSNEFVAGFHDECLANFSGKSFCERLDPKTRVAALFCVEREPAACHRSLLAARMREELGIEIVHLLPP